jgi:hypothetical protein
LKPLSFRCLPFLTWFISNLNPAIRLIAVLKTIFEAYILIGICRNYRFLLLCRLIAGEIWGADNPVFECAAHALQDRTRLYHFDSSSPLNIGKTFLILYALPLMPAYGQNCSNALTVTVLASVPRARLIVGPQPVEAAQPARYRNYRGRSWGRPRYGYSCRMVLVFGAAANGKRPRPGNEAGFHNRRVVQPMTFGQVSHYLAAATLLV